jgi:hypothetical protein
MEERKPQVFSSFDPGTEEESPGIPRVQVDGWIKITYWNGRTKVLKVRTVRVFESVMAEQLYPPSPQGYPVYDDIFPRGRLAVIPEAEAHAWLQEHGFPVPGEPSGAPEESSERR